MALFFTYVESVRIYKLYLSTGASHPVPGCGPQFQESHEDLVRTDVTPSMADQSQYGLCERLSPAPDCGRRQLTPSDPGERSHGEGPLDLQDSTPITAV